MRPKVIKIVIDSKLEEVPSVGRKVREICLSMRLPSFEAFQIELCVVEAVTNSIKHAYRLEAGHQVEITLSIVSDKFVFDICDTGIPMDSKLLEEKGPALSVDADNLESISEKGRGLAIIKKIMDNVVYTSKQGKNCFSMRKKLDLKSVVDTGNLKFEIR
ncbi:MAG: ATP-binding protein [Deltaproteobacteria bacterium]|uniref:ATP-binding protein n=1 Tax=Candidatus Methanogaster sp. TaxID=3386292 RepID=A0AC61KZJ0_9EURY|nr:MAG: ATP-binding protein [ANME-2 cluster archaeon]PXF60178.1 MAG: ATP-binding protein [Deltaproteobacteria bacterium]